MDGQGPPHFHQLEVRGDIADQEEYQSGLRREGLFVALLAWFEKAGNSLGSFLTGFLFVGIGFKASTGVRTSHTLWLMKWSYMVFPAVGALMTLFCVSRYRLTQDQVYSIKEELATRRHLPQAETIPNISL